MAIETAFGFSIGGSEPADDRLVLSKEQMIELSAPDSRPMPDTYFAVCKDDGAFYVFKKSNEMKPETGKFVKYSGGASAEYHSDIKQMEFKF